MVAGIAGEVEAMRFPLNVYWLAVIGSGVITAVTLPFWRVLCRHLGLVDDPGSRKIHSQPMPLAGGLAIWTALFGCFLIVLAALHLGWLDDETTKRMLYGLGRRRGQLTALFLGATGILALGILDDKYELRAAVKFAGQAAIGALVAAAGIRITLFVPGLIFSYAVTILWIVTVINAFNFMDNMNGLCAGLGFVATLLLGFISALHGQYLVAAISFLTAGALMGFLPYNFPRALVFLGDSGSHLVGYLVAVLAILPHFYTSRSPRPWAVLTPLLILAVPLADLAWVVVLRWRRGQPFYVGDTNHLSHRLVRLGLSPVNAVVLIWLLAGAVGALGLLWA